MKNMYGILVLSLIIAVNLQAQTTIYSTTVGGYWNESSTWIGGIVPDGNYNVVIQGPVIQHSVSGYDIYPVYCNDLTIESNGSLVNASYGGGSGTFSVYVGGNVINNGMVANGAEDFLKILIAGNLVNNNTWMPYETELQAGDNHDLSLAPGKSFGSRIINYAETLTALSDLYFTCNWNSDGNDHRDNFYLNGKTLIMGNHSIELFPTCLINKGKLQGDFEILGTFTTGWVEGYDIRDTLVFEGNITVTDTIKGNVYGGGYGIYKLKIFGNITNNGVVMDDYDTDSPLNSDDLNLLVTGNIYNYGKWNCNYTTFIGSQTQYVYQSDGKYFDTFLSDINASSTIVAQSDITVTKDINLNGATLDMANHTLQLGGWLINGNLSNSILYNGSLQNITTLNSLTIKGKVTVDDGNIFQNSIVVDDTLQSNDYGGGSKYFLLGIMGDLTNNGMIQNINSGDMLSLEIYGNVHNNGIWKNSRTRFVNNQPQTISQSANKKFVTDFYDLDSTSKIVAASDLNVEGSFNLGSSNLFMDGFEINLIGDLYNGKIHKPVIRNAKIGNVSVFDSIEIKGIVKIDDGNNFYGNLLVSDTLQSIPYGGGAHIYRLNVYGNLTNNGFIMDEPTQDENFSIYVMGDIINKGSFSNYRVYQIYYQNNTTNSIKCYNTGSTNWLVDGTNLTENNSNAFSIINGGGNQNIEPNQSYDLTIQYTPTTGDSTATLSINCNEIGSLSTIYLIGNNFNSTVDVEKEKEMISPEKFELFQNYPNPFNPNTIISWQAPIDGYQTIKIYDILGNEVATIINEYKSAGKYDVNFNATGLSSGVYFYQLKVNSTSASQIPNYSKTGKMILLK